MAKSKKQKKGKSGLFIGIGLVVFLLACGGIFLFVKQKKENEKVELEKWMKVYIKEIDRIDSEEKPDKMEMRLIKYENRKYPMMLVRYTSKNIKKVALVLSFGEKGYMTTTVDDIKVVYNRETEDYDLFAYNEEEGRKTYTQLNGVFDDELHDYAELAKDEDEKDDVGDEDENAEVDEEENQETDIHQSYDTEEGQEIYENEKFNEKYLDVDQSLEDGWHDCLDKDKNEIAKDFVEDDETTVEDVIPKESEKKKEQALEKEEKRIEAEKKAREEAEKAKKEAEEKAKKEAEKKAAEEAAKGYKIGNYTLKYGTYKSYNMPDVSVTITLSPGGKCHYKGDDYSGGNNTYDMDCTYTSTKSEYYGVMTYFLVMQFSDGKKTSWQMQKNNEFNSQWLSLKYVG